MGDESHNFITMLNSFFILASTLNTMSPDTGSIVVCFVKHCLATIYRNILQMILAIAIRLVQPSLLEDGCAKHMISMHK